MNQTRPLLALSTASLRQAPFFVLDGPDGRRLSCQWTSFSNGRAQGCEFEIVCPETPETMGCLFGMFEDDEFRMRPAVNTYQVGPHVRHEAIPELDLDLQWRGDLNSVLDTGHDWAMGADGLLAIAPAEVEA